MRTEDKKSFAEALKKLFAVYEVDWRDDVVDVWWGLMQDISLEEFRRACAKHARTSDRKPRPSHIIDIARPPKPDPEGLVVMAKNHRTPIAVMAYAYLRNWFDQPWYGLRNRALEFLDDYDEVQSRLSSGSLSRQEKHYMAKYCPGYGSKALSDEHPSRTYAGLAETDKQIVLDGEKEGVTWHGEPIAQYLEILKDTQEIRNEGVEEYRDRGKAALKTLLDHSADPYRAKVKESLREHENREGKVKR